MKFVSWNNEATIKILFKLFCSQVGQGPGLTALTQTTVFGIRVQSVGAGNWTRRTRKTRGKPTGLEVIADRRVG